MFLLRKRRNIGLSKEHTKQTLLGQAGACNSVVNMITVPEADSILQKNTVSFPAARVPIEKAYGGVLLEVVKADRDFPPFDRATMDGIAVNSAAWNKGVRDFPIEGLQKAGISALSLKKAEGCIEIMTGAVLPKGCDCVVPIEYVKKEVRVARARNEFHAQTMKNVHAKGSDARKGDVLLQPGRRLLASHIAVAAAVGKSKIRIARTPQIALVGTGDELVEVNRPVKPFQIRRSNTCALAAGLTLNGYTHVKRFHIQDDQKKLYMNLKKILAANDVVILSGGVSMGKLDFVPGVLERIKVKVLFHKVQQRPGGPLLFGKTSAGKPVFGLPGNPVSTQICLYRYVLPYLNRAMGLSQTHEDYVTVTESAGVKTTVTSFLPVEVTATSDGRRSAVPIAPKNSGDFVRLTKASGFIEVPAQTFNLPAASAYRFYAWVSIS